jgi:hypothetical protein
MRGVWRLELMPGSNFLQANAWEMEWDENAKCFVFPASALRRRRDAPLPLNENERLIIDALWDSPLITFRELQERTGLPHTTLHDRLRALQTPAKGQWVMKLESEGQAARYIVATGKERAWISGIG